MKTARWFLVWAALVASTAVLPSAARAQGFGFCAGLSFIPQPLTMQYEGADVAILASWISGEAPTKDDPRSGHTKYKVVKVFKDSEDEFEVDGTVIDPSFREGRPGQRFLLLGNRPEDPAVPDPNLAWGSPIHATPEMLRYIRDFPYDKPERSRLSHQLEFLEHPEKEIADEVFQEIVQTQSADLDLLASQFPRKKLLRWLTEPVRDMSRAGLTARCWDSADARRMCRCSKRRSV